MKSHEKENEKQHQFFNKAEDWMYRAIPTDRSHPDYLMYRRGVGSGIELGTYLVGGYGLAKGGLKAATVGFNAWRLKKGTFVAGKKLGLTKNITPVNFFKNRTYNEIESLLTQKFGIPRGAGLYNKSFYNPRTKRRFNLHRDPLHHNGKAHIDIRKRGLSSNYFSIPTEHLTE